MTAGSGSGTLPATVSAPAAFSPAEQARIDASVRYFLADVGPVPPGLATGLPLFVWDTAKMRAYPAPVRPVALGELARFLDVPVWRRAGEAPFTLRPAEVLARPELADSLFRRTYRRALAADLACPVDIVCQVDGWRLADGYHRLLAANLLGRSELLARWIPEAAIPAILADLSTLPPPRGRRS